MLSHIRSQWRKLRGPAPWWAHAIIRDMGIIMADFTKLQASIGGLTDEVTALKTQDESLKVYVQGVPGLVSAAVAAALANAQQAGDIDQTTVDVLQSHVDDAVSQIKASTDDVVAAVSANTPPAAPAAPDAPAGAGPDGAPVAVTSTDISGSAAVEGDASALAPAAPSGIAAPSPFGV